MYYVKIIRKEGANQSHPDFRVKSWVVDNCWCIVVTIWGQVVVIRCVGEWGGGGGPDRSLLLV